MVFHFSTLKNSLETTYFQRSIHFFLVSIGRCYFASYKERSAFPCCPFDPRACFAVPSAQSARGHGQEIWCSLLQYSTMNTDLFLFHIITTREEAFCFIFSKFSYHLFLQENKLPASNILPLSFCLQTFKISLNSFSPTR